MAVKVARLSRTEVEERAREQLKGAVWEGAFDRRVVSRRVGGTWVVHPGAGDRGGGPWIYSNARTGEVRYCDFVSPTQRAIRVLAIGLLMVGIALLVTRFYPRQWCGDAVTAQGGTTHICRDPNVTDPAIVALGIVVLAALGVFYSEVSGFGFTLRKRVEEVDTIARNSLQLAEELQKVRARVEETQNDLADANLETNRRLAALETKLTGTNIPLDGGPPSKPSDRSGERVPAGPEPSHEEGAAAGGERPSEDGPSTGLGKGLRTTAVLKLAREYNRARGTMVSGPRRSAELERIFSEMTDELRNAAASETDCDELMRDPDRGVRLSVYAYVLSHDAPRLLSPLVEAAALEDKPFGQYCALRAVAETARQLPGRLDPELVAKLELIAQLAGVGTDRARQVAHILSGEHRKSGGTT